MLYIEMPQQETAAALAAVSATQTVKAIKALMSVKAEVFLVDASHGLVHMRVPWCLSLRDAKELVESLDAQRHLAIAHDSGLVRLPLRIMAR